MVYFNERAEPAVFQRGQLMPLVHAELPAPFRGSKVRVRREQCLRPLRLARCEQEVEIAHRAQNGRGVFAVGGPHTLERDRTEALRLKDGGDCRESLPLMQHQAGQQQYMPVERLADGGGHGGWGLRVANCTLEQRGGALFDSELEEIPPVVF